MSGFEAGLVLALSLALLCPVRFRLRLGLAAAQGLALATTALAFGHAAEAAVLLLLNALLLSGLLLIVPSARRPPRASAPVILVAGGFLAVLAAPFGVPLAVLLLGLLLAAAERDRAMQVLGLLVMQNATALAELEQLAAVLPVIPLLTIAALWTCRRPASRGAFAWLAPPARIRRWIGYGINGLVLLLALALPWVDGAVPLPRHDPAGHFAALLVALAALGGTPPLVILGLLLAALSGEALLTLAALTLTTAAALAGSLPTAWHRVPLAGAGLGLLLFGTLLPPEPVTAGCALLGLAALAGAVPAALPLLPLLAARFAGPEAVAIGLIALLAGAAAARTRPAMAPFALAGLATMLLGLRTPDASFAALVLLLLLVLSQLAIRLAQGGGLVALLAAAGLSGLPPVGVFPALVLAVLAVVRTAPWLLVTLLPGLAALGWAAIIRLPAPRLTAADRRSLAWIPLAAALLLGWCLPAPGAAWLRAVTMEIHR